MTDSEALLRAVCADPHCDTRRLVYADTQDPGHQIEQRVWWERDPDRGDPFRR